ncbi:hypothetical protein IVB18_31945 [Bradyrhizobium sp. 186]|uniref:hypothetical protein n=1 Tax=Bradyrhizobium sp. 186 TaxID=2782654 RepID=UPI0020008858|nr:hypothetical protein [Bradyrhizobium sp. 186]UPK32840.1 hypothetical protein IVB18_31945 [Bradyrhizobium sp. 186]
MASNTYHLLNCGVNLASIPVTGNFLAHSQRSPIGRAFIGADLVTGAQQLVKPTVVQAAFLAGTNRAYVYWAIRRQPERAEIEAGAIPLVPPKANGASSLVPAEVPDFQLVDLARRVGPDRMLAAAVAAEAAE